MLSTLTSTLTSISQYKKLLAVLRNCSPNEQTAIVRELCLTDLFFLLWYGLGRKDIEHDWLLARCKEVQKDPDNHLDLWAREHYKSTIITFGKTIQDVLNDPELTVGIFSHTRPIAKGFLRQIKREFETNSLLKALFPNVLWSNPSKESPKWSEDDGLIVKRKSNPKEATIEAWGLVDGQPTSKHYKLVIYDDVVTRESVTTPDMIAKTTDALELSYNLGAHGGSRRFIGTRYHYNDTYKTIVDRKTAKPRIYPATRDGQIDGEPVLLSRERLAEKRRDMGPYTFACQMMQDPKADETQGFKYEWLCFYHGDASINTNRYMLVDAASEKRKTSDYTAIWVIGLGEDQNYYILDIVRDRLNLTQRAEAVMRLHRKWKPMEVRYEKYGLMADIEFIKHLQEEQNYRFDIKEVGGQTPKNDRIRRLIPIFENKRVYFPYTMYKTDYEGVSRDLVQTFIEEEYKAFPVSIHDDMLDSMARISEPEMPLVWPETHEEPDRYSRRKAKGSAWSV
jgi:predicted phage terminase large subunit-like protein